MRATASTMARCLTQEVHTIARLRLSRLPQLLIGAAALGALALLLME